MAIAIFLGLLFGLFFFVRKHIGPSHLAAIAGLSVYEMFGKDVIRILSELITNAPVDYLQAGTYIALVLVFPLALYLHSARGGLFGLLRIAEAGIFAALLTSLCAGVLATIFPFDQLSHDILEFINSIRGTIIAIGILAAYLDIIFYRD